MGLCKSSFKFDRPVVDKAHLELAYIGVIRALNKAIIEKGDGAFVSVGEIRGYLDEEVEELHEAQHENRNERFKSELRDVAIAAIFGLASMETWNGK